MNPPNGLADPVSLAAELAVFKAASAARSTPARIATVEGGIAGLRAIGIEA